MAKLLIEPINVDLIFRLFGENSNCNRFINAISSPEDPEDNSLCVYIKGHIPENKKNLWLLTKKKIDGYNCINVNNPKHALFLLSKNLLKIKPTKHYIDKSVSIGENVTIENGVTIGPGTIIEHGVIIHSGTIIGVNCIVRSNSVLGGKGYSFYADDDRNLQSYPHFGGVLIGDNVEVGYNCVVVNGIVDDTYIGDYTKLDNLVHIAHDCILGRNVTVTAGVSLCGYVSVGDYSRLAPNSSIKQRIKIGSSCVVGLGSVVTKNIPDGTTCFGIPAKPLRTFK